jgi:hypothetical protein
MGGEKLVHAIPIRAQLWRFAPDHRPYDKERSKGRELPHNQRPRNRHNDTTTQRHNDNVLDAFEGKMVVNTQAMIAIMKRTTLTASAIRSLLKNIRLLRE